jgi:hypothetical protein
VQGGRGEATPGSAAAETRVVTSASDDPTACAAAGVLCLRQAVEGAAEGDTITFDPTAFPAGTTIALTTPIEVRVPVTIQRPSGAAVTIESKGSEAFRRAPDASPVTLTLTGVQLRYS